MTQGLGPYLSEVNAAYSADPNASYPEPLQSAVPMPAMVPPAGEVRGPPAALAAPVPPNGPPSAPGGVVHPPPLEGIDVNSPPASPEGGPPGQVPPELRGHGQFDLTPIGGGGVTPAHEVEMRGPSLRNQQGVANEATNAAITANTQNSEAAARAEYDQALAQERAARAREAAMQQSMAERDQEFQERLQDFDDSVKSLSQMSLDPNRFWASRSTGQKVAAAISMALGGFLQGARGGSNPGLDMINTMIDRDIHAQEVSFQAARDTVNAKQTAFGLAMQKYQNVDAARSMARAAALDAVQAQLGQNAALWKDADAANRANSAIAALEDIKTQQIAQGIRFVLPTQQGRMFIDSNGLRYTEAEAKALGKEFRGYEQARELKGLDTAGSLMQERAKGEIELAKAEAERRASGGLGRKGQEALALEQAKAQQEMEANLKAIDAAKANVAAITSGTSAGTAYSHLPRGYFPGVEGARHNVNTREAYNRRVLVAVAAAYKLGTDAMEPKNREMMQHFAEPFTIEPSDSPTLALQKMDNLRKIISDSAEAKGAEPPTMSKAALQSFTPHGSK